MTERNYQDECGDHGGNKGTCGLPAGWGTDFDSGKCKFHRGTNADGSSHEENDNAVTHGAFKEHFRADLTTDEKDAIDSLVSHLEDIDDSRVVAAEVAAEALMKYKRSADDRFLREARQWFDKFNLMPSAEQLELSGEGGGGILINMDDGDD
jgi:hypothetical protein